MVLILWTDEIFKQFIDSRVDSQIMLFVFEALFKFSNFKNIVFNDLWAWVCGKFLWKTMRFPSFNKFYRYYIVDLDSITQTISVHIAQPLPVFENSFLSIGIDYPLWLIVSFLWLDLILSTWHSAWFFYGKLRILTFENFIFYQSHFNFVYKK